MKMPIIDNEQGHRPFVTKLNFLFEKLVILGHPSYCLWIHTVTYKREGKRKPRAEKGPEGEQGQKPAACVSPAFEGV